MEDRETERVRERTRVKHKTHTQFINELQMQVYIRYLLIPQMKDW